MVEKYIGLHNTTFFLNLIFFSYKILISMFLLYNRFAWLVEPLVVDHHSSTLFFQGNWSTFLEFLSILNHNTSNCERIHPFKAAKKIIMMIC